MSSGFEVMNMRFEIMRLAAHFAGNGDDPKGAVERAEAYWAFVSKPVIIQLVKMPTMEDAASVADGDITPNAARANSGLEGLASGEAEKD